MTYPDELLSNECYSLFLSLYRDRGSVDGLIADAVKDLKVEHCGERDAVEGEEQDRSPAHCVDSLSQRFEAQPRDQGHEADHGARAERYDPRFAGCAILPSSSRLEPPTPFQNLFKAIRDDAFVLHAVPTQCVLLGGLGTELLRSARGNVPASARAPSGADHLQVRLTWHRDA